MYCRHLTIDAPYRVSTAGVLYCYAPDVYMFRDQLSRRMIQKTALRMKDGNARAAAELYRMLVKQTYGFYFLRLQNRDQAENMTQEMFMKLVRSIRQYDASKGDFVVWYWQIARH